ncbi:ATP-binding protein [Dactylosporangium cerinum]
MPATPFIGRAEELAEITGAWTAQTGAASGNGPRVVLVTGEAGSGKSRLVAEVLERLDPQPPVVLAGAARTLGAAPHDWLASVLSGHPLDGGVPAELAQRSPPPAPGPGWRPPRCCGPRSTWSAPCSTGAAASSSWRTCMTSTRPA